MFALKAFIFVTMTCVVKSEVDFETMCKNNYTDLKNNQIDVSKYCSNKLCIEKCCGEDEIFHVDNSCTNKKELFQLIKKRNPKIESQANYSSTILSSRGREQIRKNFVLLSNHRNVDHCTLPLNIDDEYDILQDGSLQREESTTKKMFIIEKLKYCIDYQIQIENSQFKVKIIIRQFAADPKDAKKIQLLEVIAITISSFFLLLVLVVYCLLPDLQNLIGRVLMAYVITLLAAFILKLVIDFTIVNQPPGFCKIISPFLYFTAVSSFFWLNVMSYDVFWALRGHRKRYEINRRGERVKFMWYCLYAWGAPLLMTAVVTVLDNIDLSNTNIYTPPFEKCFDTSEKKSLDAYYKMPIGFLICINMILFCLTVYNIWMVKRAVNNCNDSTINKSHTNRFLTYTKLSVIMGVTWCLELLPPHPTLWVYILTNLYNILTGVTIFVLFVFKKKVLAMLCKKFNILQDFSRRLESSQHTRSGISRSTRTSRSSTVKNSFKDQIPELDPSQKSLKGDATEV